MNKKTANKPDINLLSACNSLINKIPEHLLRRWMDVEDPVCLHLWRRSEPFNQYLAPIDDPDNTLWHSGDEHHERISSVHFRYFQILEESSKMINVPFSMFPINGNGKSELSVYGISPDSDLRKLLELRLL